RDPVPEARRQAAQRLAAMDVEIEAVAAEGAVGLGRARAARALSSQLALAFVELDALAHRLRRCGPDGRLSAQVGRAWREADEGLAADDPMAAAERLEAATRAAFPLDAIADAAGARIAPALARWRARRALLRLAAVLRAEAGALDPRPPVAPSPAAAAETRRALARRDRGLAAVHGLRGGLAYLLALLAWRYSGWASGGLAAALAGGMTTIVSIVLPRAAHAGAGRQVAAGVLAAAAPLAALQAVAPGLEGFAAFALVCTPFLFAFSLIGAPRARRLTGVGAIFLFGFGLEPANAGFAPPLQLANTVLVLLAAAAIQHLALTLVLPETPERSRRLLDRGMRRLLAEAARRPPARPADFAATAFDLLGDHAGALDPAAPADRRRLARVSAAIVLGAELVELNRWAMGAEATPVVANRLADLRAVMATLALRPTLGAAPADLIRAAAAVEAIRSRLAQAPSPATREALMIALHLRETLAEDRLSEPPQAAPRREPPDEA
ncbi:MAG: FUSC family protein, partial [Pseudomonadota bacterium]|nr:FUSC family protein [Pseudomonadota bacterium]